MRIEEFCANTYSHVTPSAHLPLSVMTQRHARAAFMRPVQTRLVDVHHPERTRAEAFIAGIYEAEFGAKIHEHYPEILVVMDYEGEWTGACGLRYAQNGSLFLEQYLDRAVEVESASVLNRAVRRDSVVEIGNLVTTGGGTSVGVIMAAARYLVSIHVDVAVLTATLPLRRIFQRLHIPTCTIGVANPERLSDHGAAWGSYYRRDPLILAGYMPECLAALECMNSKADRVRLS